MVRSTEPGVAMAPLMAAVMAAVLTAMVTVMATCARAMSEIDEATTTTAPPAQLSEAAALASTCSGCHALQNAGTAIVSLQGLAAPEIQNRLLSFKKPADGFTAMHRIARGYTDAQIAVIARYIASQAAP
jgi:cytochrome c553